ncbi:FCS-Like Zinc finger 15-like [Vigna umbellata]|uniref:FLZ-type domain-containing protein n=2 Tax=Phaseolus angularis TaxID=3914 RepID=A0A0L9VHE6_PHAAN|nr:FCS-Like Zinc finger 15 [Vigna angularis]XP_047176503.1 FCS-Like Zinc finger 15-like [Vigna umbellata]KAG2385399.1 uncharacterized protein HKW66_Vig0124910 [Vigna angularis]KOM54119.1 hypothetical protein LR48_Vigan10g001100 [Vigna angularis]BAU03004.1 hypothetical protein VIGAN_11260600 [Vigna angularis var. angularis]
MEKSNSNPRKSSTNRNRMVLEKGVVGLGIVAAMSVTNINNSIDVVSSAKPAANFSTSYDLFHASPLNTGTRFLFPTPHFLNSCNLCYKHLHGIDIFIYRGEKAFCSAQCREAHIRNYEHEQDKYYYKHNNALNVSVPILAA